MPKKSISRICSVDGCLGKYSAKGFCRLHYKRNAKHGSPHIIGSRRFPSINERFDMKHKLIDGSDCWHWIAATNPGGYGTFSVGNNKSQSSHRFSYERYIGPIPEDDSFHGICVCHSCDNTRCVNPDHLFLGTQGDNIKDMDSKGRRSRGEKHTSAKLSVENVLEIREMLLDGACQTDIAKVFKVGSTTIWDIKVGINWSHV